MNKKLLLCGLLCVLAAGTAFAQPSVFTGGVVSAASLAPSGSSLQAVAPGSIVSIFGNNIATSTAAAANVPLPTTLGGASVTIGGKAAPLYFASVGQINAQVPVDVTPGNVPVVVTVNGASSAAVTVLVAARAPAIFTAAQNGRGPGAIQNFVAQGNTPANGFTTSVAPGGLIIVYGTGGGALTGTQVSGAACVSGTFSPTATATIGGAAATVEYSGCTPGFVGLDQYNIRIPSAASIPQGCFLPLQVTVGGVGSNMVTLSIATGGNCNTAATTGVPGGLPNQTVGAAILTRLKGSILGFNFDTSQFTASFSKFGPQGQSSSSFPPAGSGCLVEVYKVSDPNNAPIPGFATDPTAALLNVGTLSLTGPSGTTNATFSNGIYSIPFNPLAPQALTPGNYSVKATGGGGIGAFTSANLNLATLFNVTSLGFNGSTSQSSSITSTWGVCPDPSGEVMALAYSVNASGLYGSAICTAVCSAGQITIPSSVLKQLPTSSAGGFNMVLVYFPTLSGLAKITASGLDVGYLLYSDGTIGNGTLNP